MRDECFVCRLVPVVATALSYKLETAVRVSCAEARRFASQDFAPADTHPVLLVAEMEGAAYSPIAPSSSSASPASTSKTGAASTADTLTFRCPLYQYAAKEVTVEGPRLDVRGTAAHLTAALLGKYVLPGAQFTTEEGLYTVRSVTLHKGYRGIALVGADCRVRVNAAPPLAPSANMKSTTEDAKKNAARPIGFDEEVQQLQELLRCAEASPGAFLGVVVRGPRGCGVSTLVNYALNSSSSLGSKTAVLPTVLPWSAHFSASKALQDGQAGGGTVVLLVAAAEHVFAEAEPELAKLHLRKLQRDVSELRAGGNGAKSSVVALCLSHAYSLCATDVLDALFSFHVVLSYPSVQQRAALLASARGGSAADWHGAAQCLVGRTCAETLEAAQQPHILSALPFRPVPWREIGGLAEVKNRLHRALVWPQQQPERMRRFNIAPPRGILLYGPPGCAKTTLIKALCTEGNFSLIYLDSATVVSAYVGESERYLRDVFSRARRQAPCIVFFDEVEVLGGRRVVGGHDAEQVRLLSTLLTEMDGFADTRGVCFVGATNVPQLLDPALMRPGRFDYMVYVPLPTAEDRAAILHLLLCQTAADTQGLAAHTSGFSGADLKVFCSEALLELLKGVSAPPAILHDKANITAYLVDKAATFQRTHYNSAALDQFQRDHTST